jgi:sulfur carrier protein
VDSLRGKSVVTIRINGEEQSFEREPSVEDILDALEVPLSAVAVEVNRTVIPRKSHAVHVLRDGDEVEVVTFVGGG